MDVMYMKMGNLLAALVKGGWRVVRSNDRADTLLPITVDDMQFLGFVQVEAREIALALGIGTKDVPTAFAHDLIVPSEVRDSAIAGAAGPDEDIVDEEANDGWL